MNPFKKPKLPQKPLGELSHSEFEEWHDSYNKHYKVIESLPLYISSAAIIISKPGRKVATERR